MGQAYGTPVDVCDLAATERAARERFVDGFEYLWRIEGVRYSTCHLDQFDQEIYGVTDPRLEVFMHSVKRWTPTGARLWDGRHVDLRDGHKQFASRTIGEALSQFANRRRNQIKILERQLLRATTELMLCDLLPHRKTP